MSTTLGELKDRIANVMQDPDQKTFTDTLLGELVLAALVEVGRLAPEQFTEDITLVASQRAYAVRSDDFLGDAIPEIELTRVEVWDPTQEPEALVAAVPDAGLQPVRADSGWSYWGGTLYLDRRTIKGVSGHESDYVLRVYGYSPYVLPDSDSDVISISKDVEQAAIQYARVEGIKMLLASRDLFTQWQVRSGNTDISPAGLMNQLNIERDEWRSYARNIARPRAGV